MHVKLVAEVGVGTVAAGVAKAHADVVLISGHDGGTGASPLTSLKHAGGPWELGLAETQQTLLLNGLRDRIVVQTDGQLKTGRDVVIAALLGAEEFGFATAPLVVSRLHHDAGLPPRHLPGRRRHAEPGAAQALHRQAGVRRDLLRVHRRGGARAPRRAGLPHARRGGRPRRGARHRPRRSTTGRPPGSTSRRSSTCPSCPTVRGRAHSTTTQDHGLDKALDNELIAAGAGRAARRASRCGPSSPVRNVNRTVGTMLGHEVTKRYGGEGLPDGTIDITLTGSAGQSFGAFVPRGHHAAAGRRRQRLRRQGPVRRPDRRASRPGGDRSWPRSNIIAGNVIALRRDRPARSSCAASVGERFCVRNSGAIAVVEGVGDHGCEYMTGGRVVVLGPTGRNFAAGMSGGVAYVLDLDEGRVNRELVDLDPLDDDGRRAAARRWSSGTTQETGSTVARALLADWADARSRGSPRSCRATTSGCSRPARRRSSDGLDEDEANQRDHGGAPWLTRRASSPRPRGRRRGGRSTCACRTGTRSTRTVPGGPCCRSSPSRPAAAWTAASRSATRAARWATSSRSGTTWSGATTGTARSSGCTPPTTSRSSPAGCARRRARPRACSASTRTR